MILRTCLFLRRFSQKTCVCKKVKKNKKLFLKFKLIFSKIACQRSQRLHRQGVGVVNDYANTFGKLLTYFKGTIRQKKVLRCVYISNSNNLKIWKSLYLKKIGCPSSRWLWCWHRFPNFAIEYLCEIKKCCKTVLPVHMGPRLNLLRHQKMVENLVTLFL